MENWHLEKPDTFDNKAWTRECQGMTTDGTYWYVVSNYHPDPAVYKYSLDLGTRIGEKVSYPNIHYDKKFGFLDVPGPPFDHLGSPDYFEGKIYVPIEQDPPLPPLVWILDTDLHTVGVHSLPEEGPLPIHPVTKARKMPWCAINPWNGWLYTSSDVDVDQVYAYDLTPSFPFRGTLRLDGTSVDGVQSGRFTANGRLYLVSDIFSDKQATQDIRGYSALNGAFLGSCGVPYDPSWTEGEEMQGMAIVRWELEGGVQTYVHVFILDNDLKTDDVFIRHYSVPDPGTL
jgi:hypothetical protein